MGVPASFLQCASISGGNAFVGDQAITGDIVASANADFGGTLNANGAATLLSTCAITGAVTCSSTLAVTGAVTMSSTCAITGAVGIGGAATASAALTVTSTTKGFLPPRMTTTERNAIATPAAGLVVYNSTTNKLNFYNGSAWEAVTSA